VRIARYRFENDVSYGIVDGQELRQITGAPFPSGAEIEVTGVVHDLDEVDLLAPVLPTKIIAVAKNYSDHAKEMGGEVPGEPMIFLKPSTAVIGPEGVIRLPAQSERVDHEAELAVVIGRLCKDVPEQRVDEVILGYTCANDVTARDLQAKDGQWGRAKGFDTFCPLGPWIETDFDPDDAGIECEVNDQVRQDGSTADMVRSVAELVSWISAVMTLVPGDVILTGTPAGVGPLRNGDTVTVTIEGIGTLDNIVSDTGVFS
jgi:2-keto-4-pentenoate hydratase/2-oxohepta-3-ene-1,7-dioic acid hydratase in catechol pathway